MLTNLIFSSYIVYPLILVFLINYLYKKFFALNYWERVGVRSLKPTLPFLGNFYELFLGKTNIDLINSLHDKVGDRPFAGLYAFTTPLLILKDPDLIKRILIKDFQCFVDRGFNTNPDTDPIARNLIHMTSKDWKAFRPRLGSVYSASRVKTTIESVVNICEDVMVKVKEEEMKQNGVGPKTSGGVEMSDLFTRFATDCYTNNSLGFNERTVANGRKSEFYRYGMMSLGWFFMRHVFIGSFYPGLHRLFRMGVANKEVTQYFQKLADKCVRSREDDANHSIINNDKNNENADLLDTLITLREDSKLSSQNGNTVVPVVDDQFLAAQIFSFYIAGSDSVGNTLAFCLYELALQPELQAKVRSEARQVLDSTEDITLQRLNYLKYTGQVLSGVYNFQNHVTHIIFRPLPFMHLIESICKQHAL